MKWHSRSVVLRGALISTRMSRLLERVLEIYGWLKCVKHGRERAGALGSWAGVSHKHLKKQVAPLLEGYATCTKKGNQILLVTLDLSITKADAGSKTWLFKNCSCSHTAETWKDDVLFMGNLWLCFILHSLELMITDNDVHQSKDRTLSFSSSSTPRNPLKGCVCVWVANRVPHWPSLKCAQSGKVSNEMSQSLCHFVGNPREKCLFNGLDNEAWA